MNGFGLLILLILIIILLISGCVVPMTTPAVVRLHRDAAVPRPSDVCALAALLMISPWMKSKGAYALIS